MLFPTVDEVFQLACERSNHVAMCFVVSRPYHIAGNFQGENFSEFHGFVAIYESFLHKIWGVAYFGGKMEQSAKVFSAKIVFFTNSRKFSPLKVSGGSSCYQCLGYIIMT